MRAGPAFLASLASLALALAGCSGDPAPDGPADASAPLGEGLAAVDLTSIPAPAWEVGQWWEWEVSFGSETREGTFCSIVVAVDGGAYTLATENTDWAKEEAAFDHPLLGSVLKPDLAMAGPGGDWSILSFPLSDGKAWTASIPNIAWDVFLPAERVDVDMEARFAPATHGEVPRVDITGTKDGFLILQAEFDPATGWFSGLRFFDVDPGQEELEVGYRAKSSGLNYTGPYFQHTARPLLQFFDGNGFDDDPTAGGQPFAEPDPYKAFTATEGTTLYGYVVAETVAAARAVVLVDPNNQERHFESHDAEADGDGVALFFDEPAVAGEWRLATAGAGGFSGAFGEIFEVAEGAHTL